MGFFDTIAGVGRSIIGGIGAVLETGIEVLGPPIATAFAQSLVGQILPGASLPRTAGPGGFAPAQFRPQQFGFPQAIPTAPIRQALPFLPQPALDPRRFQQVSHFPSGGVVPGVSPASFSLGGATPVGFDLPFIDIVPQGGGATLGALTAPFRPTMAGASANTFVVPNPVTGRPTWFRPAGRPLIWSADLVAVRRVRKLAARAHRVTGHRRSPR